jgi:hypothetical protein
MLIFNDRAYCQNDKEFTESLFHPINGRTANGFYERTGGGIRLFNLQHELFAFIKSPNKQTEAFVVSAYNYAGQVRYMHALTSTAEKYLGFDPLTYSEMYGACAAVFQS